MKKTILIFSSLLAIMGISMASTTIKPQVNDNINNVKVHQQVPTLAPMISKVIPAVVSINVEGMEQVKPLKPEPKLWGMFPLCEEGSPLKDSPICKAKNETDTRKFYGLGSGVILNATKGYVVTNFHVLENATQIEVVLSDGRRYDAKVIAKDYLSDLAVIQLIDFKDLTAIKWSDSDTLQVGDYSIAIGNPYGLGSSVTAGMISGLGRGHINNNNQYANFIQTDAPINRGNSGGALINLKGELIGINTAILYNEAGSIGIGFAIPSNIVKNITDQMIKYGKVTRGTLGLRITNVTPDLAEAMKLNVNRGVFISSVFQHSSAHAAGIKAGDVIISLNNSSIGSLSSFKAELSSFPIGTPISLGLVRDGKKINVKVIIEKIKPAHKNSTFLYQGLEGAQFSNIKIKGQKGIKVDSVEEKSDAFTLGLRVGDIILSINKKEVKNVKELHNLLLNSPPYLSLHILRGDKTLYLLIQ
ncbi:MAG: Do family serine endopeptidase [Candidatus Dasytiphilus stammeri]